MTFLVLPAQLLLYEIGNPILLTPFVGQTAFVAVLAAMIVNISWATEEKPIKPTSVPCGHRRRQPESDGLCGVLSERAGGFLFTKVIPTQSPASVIEGIPE
jgi:hypothetical protein